MVSDRNSADATKGDVISAKAIGLKGRRLQAVAAAHRQQPPASQLGETEEDDSELQRRRDEGES